MNKSINMHGQSYVWHLSVGTFLKLCVPCALGSSVLASLKLINLGHTIWKFDTQPYQETLVNQSVTRMKPKPLSIVIWFLLWTFIAPYRHRPSQSSDSQLSSSPFMILSVKSDPVGFDHNYNNTGTNGSSAISFYISFPARCK